MQGVEVLPLPRRADWVGRYRALAIACLGFTLAVILWGAFVRITGAGAGCGSHWPTCNGEVIPNAPSTKMLIEYVHRLTSGASGILTLVNLVLAFVLFPSGSATRKYAVASGVLMASEAGIGAALVLFEHVATDARIGRAYWMSLHLVNTFLLVASMAALVLSVRPAADSPDPDRAARWIDGDGTAQRARSRLLVFGGAAIAVLAVGVTGAIAALGDTLFPAVSLAEGIRADFSPHAHAFLALRTLHPFVAVAASIGLLVLASAAISAARPQVRWWGRALAIMVVVQVSVGALNLLLLAPAVMQLIHLLVADAVWISLVGLAFRTRKRA